MAPSIVYLPLIDEARLHAALELAPGGGGWDIASTQVVPGTGSNVELQLWVSGEHRRQVTLRGPTVTGLSDTALEAERQRLLRIREATQHALDAVEGHLRFRRGLR